MSLPRTAYVTLWFPKPSETFVVSEADALRKAGLPLSVHALYGPLKAGLPMQPEGMRVERLGLANAPSILLAVLTGLLARPLAALGILGRVLLSPGGGLEKYGENILAMLCGFRLAKRFRELGVEHTHAGWANGSATAAWCAARLNGIPFSFTARAGDVHPPDGLLRRKLDEASFVLVDSSFLVPHLAAHNPRAAGKIRLVHAVMTLPPAAEAPVPMRPPVRIVAIGRFVKTKGFQHLLDALALVRARGLDARLTLAGDGPWMGRLRARTARLGLEGMVDFPGFLPHAEVPALLLAADMLAMPSIRRPNGDSDGLPTVLIEALLHRVPVLATRLAGIPDLVEDGVTGLLTPEGDAEAIATVVLRLAGDREAALAMAARGRDRALEMFTPEGYVAAFFKLLAAREAA
ncbi:MAG: glycosyltransferase [Humidesulfovibrio sp.]|nr:glycosyltransferase [Humidesulfovibrio sp.]